MCGGQMNCIQHKPMLELVQKLTPHTSKLFSAARGPVQYHFANSGAEGIENAVKLARTATGKPNVIVFQVLGLASSSSPSACVHSSLYCCDT
jgi:4-aminobutyrate aminotransferase/(S)-3-amino-2-methylpropionate transaminase